jgi:hypothetical protein
VTDEKPSRAHRDYTGEPAPSRRAKRSTMQSIGSAWTKIPVAVKIITLLVGIFGSGFSAAIWLVAETSSYATKGELGAHAAIEEELREQVRVLQTESAVRQAELAAISKDVGKIAEGVKEITEYLIHNPPPRGGRK